jgi:hypothetical protein
MEIASGNQTWIAGLSSVSFDDFPSYPPPFWFGDFPEIAMFDDTG